jgi:hypothetical protein
MDDDDRNFSALDPSNLLPFTCELEAPDPTIPQVPKNYVIVQPQLDGAGDNTFLFP